MKCQKKINVENLLCGLYRLHGTGQFSSEAMHQVAQKVKRKTILVSKIHSKEHRKIETLSI